MGDEMNFGGATDEFGKGWGEFVRVTGGKGRASERDWQGRGDGRQVDEGRLAW